MRQIICYITLFSAVSGLAGCGQSGALQLPSDPNLDTRAKYLLYSPKNQQKSHSTEQHATSGSDQRSASEPTTSP